MKKALLILTIGSVLASCNSKNKLSDAYGNFEATETMISAEAGGKLISFNIEEGTVIDSAAIVGCVDTVQLQLKKQQLAAQIENAQARTESVLSQIDVQKEQIKTLLVEKERIERLLIWMILTVK